MERDKGKIGIDVHLPRRCHERLVEQRLVNAVVARPDHGWMLGMGNSFRTRKREFPVSRDGIWRITRVVCEQMHNANCLLVVGIVLRTQILRHGVLDVKITLLIQESCSSSGGHHLAARGHVKVGRNRNGRIERVTRRNLAIRERTHSTQVKKAFAVCNNLFVWRNKPNSKKRKKKFVFTPTAPGKTPSATPSFKRSSSSVKLPNEKEKQMARNKKPIFFFVDTNYYRFAMFFSSLMLIFILIPYRTIFNINQLLSRRHSHISSSFNLQSQEISGKNRSSSK